MGLFLPRTHQRESFKKIRWASPFASGLLSAHPLVDDFGDAVTGSRPNNAYDSELSLPTEWLSVGDGRAPNMYNTRISTPRVKHRNEAGAITAWFYQRSGASMGWVYKTRDHSNDNTTAPLAMYIDNGSATFQPCSRLGALNSVDDCVIPYWNWPMQSSMLDFPIFIAMTWTATTLWLFCQHQTNSITRTKTLAFTDSTQWLTSLGSQNILGGTYMSVWDCRVYDRTLSRAEFDEMRLNPLARRDLYL